MGCSSDGVSHTVPSHENCASENTLQLVLCWSVGKQIFVGTAAATAAADCRGGSGCTCAGNSRHVVTYQDNTIIPKEGGTMSFEGNQLKLANTVEQRQSCVMEAAIDDDILNPMHQLNHPNKTHKIKPLCIMKTFLHIASFDDKKSMKSPIQVPTIREHSFLFLEHFVE